MFDAIASISPPHRLSLAYLTAKVRPLLTLFLIMDSRISDIHSNMNEAMMAQIRLAWWRDTLNSSNRPKGEPLISLIEDTQIQYPNTNIAQDLIKIIDGWEYLIISDNIMSQDALLEYAQNRGATMFETIAKECGETDLIHQYGKLGVIWALSSLYSSDSELSSKAREAALIELNSLELKKLSRNIRALTILAYPAIRTTVSLESDGGSKQEGLTFGISYIWHAISGRWGFKVK